MVKHSIGIIIGIGIAFTAIVVFSQTLLDASSTTTPTSTSSSDTQAAKDFTKKIQDQNNTVMGNIDQEINTMMTTPPAPGVAVPAMPSLPPVDLSHIQPNLSGSSSGLSTPNQSGNSGTQTVGGSSGTQTVGGSSGTQTVGTPASAPTGGAQPAQGLNPY